MLSDTQMLATPVCEVDFALIDPPWHYKTKLAGMHVPYPTLTTDEIIARRPNLAADAIVLMWTTSTHFPDALRILAAWGLAYTGITFVWDKCRPVPGWYTMGQCEFVVMGKRGKPGAVWRGYSGVKQCIYGATGVHSRKPEELQNLLDSVLLYAHVRRLEMYARQVRPGWVSWGNEIPGGMQYTPHISPFEMSCTDTMAAQTGTDCGESDPSSSRSPPPGERCG